MEGSKKQLGFLDCLSIGIGQIIGSGIMVFTGIALALTGHGTPLAFLLCIFFGIASLVVSVVLSSALPSNGGGYYQISKLIGPKFGFVYLGMFVLSQVLIATVAIGFAQYFAVLFPNSNQKVVAMVVLTFATVVNYFGVKSAAGVQNIMVTILLIVLTLFIACGLPHVDWSSLELSAANIMPNGPLNFLQAASILTFAIGGANFLAETADEVKNPGKTVPIAMVASTVIVGIFYTLIGVVASGVLPIEEVAGQPLTAVAQKIFPTWLYYVFIIGGALMALLTTLNGTLSWVTRGLQLSAKDGWLPEIFAKENKHGTPVLLLLVFYVVGAIPILTGMDTSLISNMGINLTTVYSVIQLVACWRLPTVMPEAYEKAAIKFKVPVLRGLLLLSLACKCIVIFATTSGMDMLTISAAVLFVVAVIIYAQFRWKYIQKTRAWS